MDTIWYLIDGFLVLVNLPVTDEFRWATLITLVVGSLIFAVLLAFLVEESLYYRELRTGKSRMKKEEPKPQVAEVSQSEEVDFEPELRARWALFNKEEYESRFLHSKEEPHPRLLTMEEGGLPENLEKDEDYPKPIFFGYVAEVQEGDFNFFLGAQDTWFKYQASTPIALEMTSKMSLLRALREAWLANGQIEVPEDKRHAYFQIDIHNWKDVLKEVSSRPLEEGTVFSWDMTDWFVEDVLGPYRVLNEGNQFFQGRELATLYNLRSRDRQAGSKETSAERESFSRLMELVLFVEYTGGRDHMGGAIYMWGDGKTIGKEEVESWRRRQVKLSSRMVEAALTH